MRPGNEPIRRLARALLQRDGLGPSLFEESRLPASRDAQTLEVSLLEAELRRGPLGLVDTAAAASREEMLRGGLRASDGFNLLLLVDQFEELFTYLEASGHEARGALAEEAEAFVNLLLAARSAPQARVFVVMTLRTDFLGQCVRFLELPDAINRAQYLTPRLARDEIERAITGPARHFGGAVEPQLVSELINAVGSDPDQLPVLQHALSQMWEFARSRTGTSDPTIGWTDFKSAGGVKHALSQHADKALAGLSGQAALGDCSLASSRSLVISSWPLPSSVSSREVDRPYEGRNHLRASRNGQVSRSKSCVR